MTTEDREWLLAVLAIFNPEMLPAGIDPPIIYVELDDKETSDAV